MIRARLRLANSRDAEERRKREAAFAIVSTRYSFTTMFAPTVGSRSKYGTGGLPHLGLVQYCPAVFPEWAHRGVGGHNSNARIKREKAGRADRPRTGPLCPFTGCDHTPCPERLSKSQRCMRGLSTMQAHYSEGLDGLAA